MYQDIESLDKVMKKMKENPIVEKDVIHRDSYQIKRYKVNYFVEYLDIWDDIEYLMKREKFDEI